MSTEILYLGMVISLSVGYSSFLSKVYKIISIWGVERTEYLNIKIMYTWKSRKQTLVGHFILITTIQGLQTASFYKETALCQIFYNPYSKVITLYPPTSTVMICWNHIQLCWQLKDAFCFAGNPTLQESLGLFLPSFKWAYEQ